jgi:putative ABC transport system substrate-binding protein
LITLLGGAAAAWPLGARAQQGERTRRVGVLMNLAADDPEGQTHCGVPAGAAAIGLDRRPRRADRLPMLFNADNPAGSQLILRELEPTVKALKVELLIFEARGPGDFEGVFAAMVNRQIGAVVLHEDPMLNANSKAIVEILARQRLLTCGFPEFAAAGGLMAYGVNLPEMDRRAAVFVDKILKGAKPADLPVERATKFTTIVNLRTARAMGIDMPTSILLRADEVIE